MKKNMTIPLGERDRSTGKGLDLALIALSYTRCGLHGMRKRIRIEKEYRS